MTSLEPAPHPLDQLGWEARKKLDPISPTVSSTKAKDPTHDPPTSQASQAGSGFRPYCRSSRARRAELLFMLYAVGNAAPGGTSTERVQFRREAASQSRPPGSEAVPVRAKNQGIIPFQNLHTVHRAWRLTESSQCRYSIA